MALAMAMTTPMAKTMTVSEGSRLTLELAGSVMSAQPQRNINRSRTGAVTMPSTVQSSPYTLMTSGIFFRSSGVGGVGVEVVAGQAVVAGLGGGTMGLEC